MLADGVADLLMHTAAQGSPAAAPPWRDMSLSKKERQAAWHAANSAERAAWKLEGGSGGGTGGLVVRRLLPCSQCFAKCAFTGQFDRLSYQLCQSLDRLSDQFAKHRLQCCAG